MHAAFDQHTAASSLRDPGQYRRRCPDRQGTGRGRHQQKHASVKALRQRHPPQHGRQDDHQDHEHQNGGHEPGGETACKALGGTLLTLGFGYHLHYPAKRIVLSQTGNFDLDCCFLVNCAGKDLIPWLSWLPVHSHL